MSHIFTDQLQDAIDNYIESVDKLSHSLYLANDEDVDQAFDRYLNSALLEIESKRRRAPVF